MKDKNKIYPLEKQLNFIKLVDEAMSENMDEITRELEEAGIDVKQIQKDLLELVNSKRAEILIARGKLFDKIYNEEKEKIIETEIPEDVALAFRQDKSGNADDSLTDEEVKKLAAIRKSGDKIWGKPNEQSDKSS